MRKGRFAGALAVAVLFALLPGVAMAQSRPAPAPQAAPATGNQPNGGANPETILAQAARRIGVERCYLAVDQVSAHMYTGTQRADVVLDWDRQDPDRQPFFSLSGLEYPQNSAVLSLTTVPSPAGGCAVLVERISSTPGACADVARTELPGYQGSALVKSVTVYVERSRPRETVTLIDAPPSCVVIRRQVQYGWGAPK
jgi:hypothetical protein